MKQNDIYNVSLDEFEKQVLDASNHRPVLVDFWADWCPPCLVIAPLLEKAVILNKGAVALAKVEVDEGENMKLAGRYHVKGFPTVILIRHSEELTRFSGAKSLQFILELISLHARSDHR